MNVLVLTSFSREPSMDRFYQHLSKLVNVEKHVLDKSKQKNLRISLHSIPWHKYERVFLDLQFKNVYKQTYFLSSIRGLLIYEEDACQNYITSSKWHGKFSTLYKKLPSAKIIVTGASTAQQLRDENIDAYFVPKSYDEQILFDETLERDIELGFIGRIASNTYAKRNTFLTELAKQEPLHILRTKPGEEYRKMLNRIRFFVSADIGLDEYMIKNFEAMACGCVVLAWRQHLEETAIGLEDGKHLLLYSSLNEILEHIKQLRKDTAFANRIAKEGKVFVEKHLTHKHLAEKVSALLHKPWCPPKEPSRWRKYLFGNYPR